MKHISSLAVLVFFSSLFIVSCTTKEPVQKSEKEYAEESFRQSLSSADSLSVLNLSDSLMSLFKSGQIDAAIECISLLDSTGNIQKLTPEREKMIRRQFSFFPVYDYTISNLVFNTSDQNIVSFKIAFEEAAPGKTPSITNFALSPVKVDGKWYLTVRESATGDGHNTEGSAN